MRRHRRERGNLDSATTTTTSPPTTTTVSPPSTTTSTAPTGSPEDDIALVEAALAAWYDTDFETVSALLDLSGFLEDLAWTIDDVRQQMAYDSAVGGRPESLTCTPPGEQGQRFSCWYLVASAATDALGIPTSDLPLVQMSPTVIDGRVASFEIYPREWPNEVFADYFEETGKVGVLTAWEDGGCHPSYEPTPPGVGCAEMLLEHMEGFVEWFQANG